VLYVGLILTGLLVLSCRSREESTGAVAMPVHVEAVAVKVAELQQAIPAVGLKLPAESYRSISLRGR